MRRKKGRLCGPAVGAAFAAAAGLAAACGAAGAAPNSEPGPAIATSTRHADPAPACTAKRPVVVLDPGHSGGPNFDSTAEVDGPKAVTALGITFHPVDIDNSGIQSIDNGGAPGELLTMSRAALRIQKILRADGYAADLTKSSANENVGLLERVREASNDHATIAVSLHYTGGIPFGEANAHFGVTPQHVGRYRTNASNGDTIRFTNARVAAESQRDAKIIQQARAAAGDGWTWHRSTRVSRSPVGCRRTATSQSSRSSTRGSRGSTTRTATSDSISTPTPPGSPTASSRPCPSHHASDHTLEAVPRRSPGSDHARHIACVQPRGARVLAAWDATSTGSRRRSLSLSDNRLAGERLGDDPLFRLEAGRLPAHDRIRPKTGRFIGPGTRDPLHRRRIGTAPDSHAVSRASLPATGAIPLARPDGPGVAGFLSVSGHAGPHSTPALDGCSSWSAAEGRGAGWAIVRGPRPRSEATRWLRRAPATLVHAVLMKSLPVVDPKTLYRVGDKDDCCVNGGFVNDDGDFDLFSYELYRHFRDTTPEFEQLAAMQSGRRQA